MSRSQEYIHYYNPVHALEYQEILGYMASSLLTINDFFLIEQLSHPEDE